MRKRKILMFFLPLFLSICVINIHAQITIQAENKPIGEIIRMIEKESGYSFFYNNNLPGIDTNKSVNISNVSIEETLKQVFSGTGIHYELKGDKQILLKYNNPENTDSKPIGISQSVTLVKGTVTDIQGQPLLGAVVVNKRTNKGLQTNIDGHFEIEAGPNDLLVISLIGFESKDVKVGNKTTLDISLRENTDLDEVVVVGYGVQQRKSITGAIASIDSKEIIKAPVADAANALTGRLPGLRVVDRGGAPGAAPGTIDIRGFGSALIIVDGVPANFQQLDPNEIESISILKDAAAAVYGIRASNGVIIVTTKRGTIDRPKFSFSSNFGWQQPTKFPKGVNSAQYQEMMLESEINRTGKPNITREELDKWRAGGADYPNTDWYKEVIRDFAPQQQYNMNVRGGSEKINYFTSLGFLNQGGIYRSGDTSFKRYNFRTNVDAKLASNLTARINLSGRKEDREAPYESFNFVMGGLLRNHPMYSPYVNGDKNYPAVTNLTQQNPAVLTNKDMSGYNRQETKVFEGKGEIQYDAPFLQGLTAKGSFFYRTYNTWDKRLRRYYDLFKYDKSTDRVVNANAGIPPQYLYESMSAGSTTIGQTTLEYKTSFGNHDIAALYVGEYTKTWNNYVTGSRDFLFNMEELNLGLATGQKNEGSGSEKNSIGHVGRINYSYDSRYLLEVSFRYDASSTYPKVKRWGFFPGASVGWRITEESFMKPYSSIISNLKLRASTSRLGDDASMEAYSDRAGYQTPGKNINGDIIPGYIFGSYGGESEFIYPTVSSLGIPNDQLTWMIAKTSNVGLDFGLFNNKLTGEIDFFYRSRDGKRATRLTSLPLEFGQKMPQENLNSDSHRGFEIMLRYQNRLGNDLSYSIGGNMSFTRAKYEYLEQAEATNSYNNWRINDSYRWMNKRFGYKSAGQFKSYEEIANWAIQDNNGNNSLSPGDIKYVDLNGDGVIDANDQTVIGRNNTPEIMFGLDLSVEYKTFDISFSYKVQQTSMLTLLKKLRCRFSMVLVLWMCSMTGGIAKICLILKADGFRVNIHQLMPEGKKVIEEFLIFGFRMQAIYV